MMRDTFRCRRLSPFELTFSYSCVWFHNSCYFDLLLLNDARQIGDYACYVHFDDILDTSSFHAIN